MGAVACRLFAEIECVAKKYEDTLKNPAVQHLLQALSAAKECKEAAAAWLPTALKTALKRARDSLPHSQEQVAAAVRVRLEV